MALIPLSEAAKLGLLPREFEDFFPGIARSSLFGSPLTLNLRQFRPGAGALERGVGRFGFQHGVPGIAGVRFGLGPLMQGLGLSPGPSAVTAPGVVPGGRARTGGEGAPSAGTLAGRAQPQDIEAIRRLLESGQLDPRALPSGLVAALGRAAPPPPARRAISTPAPAAAEPSGIAEALGQTRQALTAASAANQLVRALQGAPPPALPPSEALVAQRAGERAPFGAVIAPSDLSVEAARTLEGVLGPLSPEEAAQLTPEDIAQLEALAGEIARGVLPGALPTIPTDITAGIEAGVIPPTEGGGLTLPSAGPLLGGLGGLAGAGFTAANLAAGGGGSDVQKGLAAAQALTQGASGAAQLTGSALGGVAPALPYIGAALGIGQTIAGDEPAHIKALDAAAYAGAPFTFGLTALLPTIAELTGLKKLFRGKPDIPHAVREARELQRHAGQASELARDITGAASFDDLYRTLLSAQSGYVGGTRPQAVGIGLREMMSPGKLQQLVGAGEIFLPGGRQDAATYFGELHGTTPSLETGWGIGNPNPYYPVYTQKGFERVMRERPESLYAGVQAGVSQSMLTGLNEGIAGVIRRQMQLLDAESRPLQPPSAPETIPPSPAAPPPAPSAGTPDQGVPVPGLPPLPSLQRGGVVPRTGAYRLEAGEVVVPATGGRVIETRKEGNLYVPVDAGAPERAKKNPDPQRFWRVVLSSQEAQDAIRSGDPAETPIWAYPGVMDMGPQKRAASLEFLRRAQHQNPAGTLMDALAVSEEEATPTLPPPSPRFPIPRAFPRGLAPAGI